MSVLTAHGLSVQVPSGWDAFIRQAVEDPIAAPGPPGQLIARGGTTSPLIHIANFALPAQRGDYGQGALQLMRSHHIFVALLEHDREAAATALFQQHRGMPILGGGDFRRETQVVMLPGACGSQVFFTERNRAFCLYVVLGSWAARKPLAKITNDVLGGVEIGDRT